MKITILQKNLKQALNVVSSITGKNVSLPILGNIKITAKDKTIVLSATNLEIGIQYQVRGRVEMDGDLMVDSKLFLNYINNLPNDQVSLSLEGEKLKVKCQNYKTTINCQSAEDFPLIPEVESVNKIEILPEELRKSLAQVAFSVSGSDTRADLSGVLVYKEDSRLFFVATDSYRLAEKSIELDPANSKQQDFRIIMPQKTVQEVIKVVASVFTDNGDFEDLRNTEVVINENQIQIVVGPATIVSRLIEGQFPDYRQILPANHKTKTLVVKADLMRAVKASALFSQNNINDIALDFSQSKKIVIVSASSGQLGENITEVSADVEGEDGSMVLNYRYLIEGLQNFDSEKVEIKIVDRNLPMIMAPEKDSSCLYVIMPIKQ